MGVIDDAGAVAQGDDLEAPGHGGERGDGQGQGVEIESQGQGGGGGGHQVVHVERSHEGRPDRRGPALPVEGEPGGRGVEDDGVDAEIGVGVLAVEHDPAGGAGRRVRGRIDRRR